jgi:hypothetical protein
MDEQISVPVTSLFFQEVQHDLQTNFHPCMAKLQGEIVSKADAIREEAKSRGWIAEFKGDLIDEPVLGVDASAVSRDYGEISTALAIGVVSSTNERVEPKYFYQATYGTSSETFSKVPSHIRVAQELTALKYACDSGCWVMYDGSFNALNMDLCKFAASMPDDLDGSLDDPDFLEWELVKDCYRRCLLSADSDWFTVFGQPNGKGANNLISLSKKGISKYYSRKLQALSGITNNAFLPSDKLVLSIVLRSEEYTPPVSYEQVFQDSHGSKVPGYGKPHTGKNNLEKQHQRVEATFKNMRIVNFRPWPWSPVMTIHYNKVACKLEEVLGIVKAQTTTRSVMEPMPLYLADLLSKQASSVIKLYGEINVGRYPNLFRAFRTSLRK